MSSGFARRTAAEDLRSASIALGPFGDLVQYGGGDLYLSWYPVGRRGMVTTLTPPSEWSDGASAE